jgi:hypothetical protein
MYSSICDRAASGYRSLSAAFHSVKSAARRVAAGRSPCRNHTKTRRPRTATCWSSSVSGRDLVGPLFVGRGRGGGTPATCVSIIKPRNHRLAHCTPLGRGAWTIIHRRSVDDSLARARIARKPLSPRQRSTRGASDRVGRRKRGQPCTGALIHADLHLWNLCFADDGCAGTELGALARCAVRRYRRSTRMVQSTLGTCDALHLRCALDHMIDHPPGTGRLLRSAGRTRRVQSRDSSVEVDHAARADPNSGRQRRR